MMKEGCFLRDEPRTSPRFVPEERLSMLLADGMSSRVQGDVKNLSELGACVMMNGALQSGGAVTVDVLSGYSFLFRAEARVVWRAESPRSRESQDCVHGMLFTDLSPFTRKLIRRLGGLDPTDPVPPGVVDTRGWDVETDPDLNIVLSDATWLRGGDERFDLLSDPLEELMYGQATDLASDPELSGHLGYFTTTDVLQMLEASRATGILYFTGGCRGEIHLENGRICGCFSDGLSQEGAAFALIYAEDGSFQFVPSRVRSNLPRSCTTTQLLLEAQLRLDRGHRG